MCQIFVHRLKSSNFIIESKMAELNQKKINSKQPDQPDAVWKLYFTLEKNEYHNSRNILHMFHRIDVLKVFKQISKKAVNLGSFFNVQCIFFLEASKKLI